MENHLYFLILQAAPVESVYAMKKILPILLSSLLSAFFAVWIYRVFEEPQEVIIRDSSMPMRYEPPLPIAGPTPSIGESSAQYIAPAIPQAFSKAAANATPTVVNIKAIDQRPLDWLHSGSGGTSTGSGVIISADGFIVTNNHVVEEGDNFEVTLADKREFEARLIGTDPTTDLALLKIDASALPFLQFGNSDSLLVGEWVLAVGNPFNLESTVTAGIVSAKGRNIDILEGAYSIESFIQTDAAVNPGNSGGALVNTRGELVGINTAIITRSGRYEGYSFAVPANLVWKVIADLKDYGIVQRGILGVGIDDLNIRQAKRLGLENANGVLITRVTPEGGADDAGLERGDIILEINDIAVASLPELQELVARYRPGDQLNVRYWREGEDRTVRVTLKNQYNATDLPPQGTRLDLPRDLGFELRNLSPAEQERLQSQGVFVVTVYRYSLIESTQLESGYIITHINGERVRTVAEAIAQLEDAEDSVRLTGFYEGIDEEYFYVFEL
jgi:serine protease Do